VISRLEVVQVPGQDFLVVADRDQPVAGRVESDAADKPVFVSFAAENSDTFSGTRIG
jgi:hypothetical protein